MASVFYSRIADLTRVKSLPVNISIFTWIPASDFALLAQSLDHRQYKFHLYLPQHRMTRLYLEVGAHQELSGCPS